MKFWRKNPVIYEINTAVWLGELSLETGYPVTLSLIPGERWDALAKVPVDAVWLMGVWERSPAGIEISGRDPGNLNDFRNALPGYIPGDNIGSPYCIRNYRVDPRFGGDEGLAVARRELDRRGIRLILDFVPNHLAHDHPWTREDPDIFIRGTEEEIARDPVSWTRSGGNILACGRDPWYPAWQDVVQVNAFSPALRQRMTETLRKIAGMCDGVRCDMAMLVMNRIFCSTWGERAGTAPALDFWQEMIPTVRQIRPEFLFMAEAYWDTEFELQQQGFDYCYDKRLYDRLEHRKTASVLEHLSAGIAFQSGLVRFLENHDEPRHVTAFPPPVNRAAAVIAYTLPGARLFHEGQFEGRKVRIPVFLARRPAERPDAELASFYQQLLRALGHPMFHEGEWILCHSSGWSGNTTAVNILAWLWQSGSDRVLIVVNYSGTSASGHIRIPSASLQGRDWHLHDWFSGEEYRRSGTEMTGEGLYVELPPWQFHFLGFTPG